MPQNNKVYQYKGNEYVTIGKTRTKNSQTRQWEDHVLYQPMIGGVLCTREVTEFENRFQNVNTIPTSDLHMDRQELINVIDEIFERGGDAAQVADYIENLVTREVKIARSEFTLKNLLDPIEVVDRLEKYISPAAKKFWVETNNYIDDTPYQPGDPESRLLHVCYMGITVERTYNDLVNNKDGEPALILEQEFEAFAKLINKATLKGYIERGCIFKPTQMALAIISPSQRTMILYSPMTGIPNSELRKISNVFLHEGQLPYLLKDIVFND